MFIPAHLDQVTHKRKLAEEEWLIKRHIFTGYGSDQCQQLWRDKSVPDLSVGILES